MAPPPSAPSSRAGTNCPPTSAPRLKRRQGVPYPLEEAVTVLDPETMREVPRDGETIGEVMFRGNIVMKGYLKNEKATQEAFAGGWFHTGDLGVLDEHGYVIIKDRSKDIIISGGENISSVEVEDILYKHPAVLFAAVVAKPDSKWGEVPCAFVELKEGAKATEADIIAFCRSHMSGFKTPKAVVFGADPEDVDRQDPEIHAAQSGGIRRRRFRRSSRRVGKRSVPPSREVDARWWHGACAPLPTLRLLSLDRRIILRRLGPLVHPVVAHDLEDAEVLRCRIGKQPRDRIRCRLDRPANRPDARNAPSR